MDSHRPKGETEPTSLASLPLYIPTPIHETWGPRLNRPTYPRHSVDDLAQRLAVQVRTKQIFILAMIVVPLIFAVVVYAIGSQAPQNPAPIRGKMVDRQAAMVVIERLALVVGLLTLVVHPWIGSFVTGQSIRVLVREGTADPEHIAEAYLTGTLVACGMNEAAAFLNLIAFMPTQSLWNLGMALLLILSSAFKMPTAKRVAAWARNMAQRLAEKRIINAQAPITNGNLPHSHENNT